MGQERLLADAFRTDALVRPFKRPLARELGYYAVWPSERRIAHGTRRFVEWLVAQGTAAAKA
jgi:LysR family glycine cleavage system transcriptional activator